MATPLSADKVVSALKAEGVNVREYKEWRTHNRNHVGSWGGVNGIVIHHTAGRDSLSLVYNGRSDLPGPLAHAHLAKDGTCSLVGHGRANHAGLFAQNAHNAVVNESSNHPTPDYSETVDGNQHYYGIEIENLGDGKDYYPTKQYDQAVRWAAALCRAHGWTANSIIGHKEGTRRKIDPKGPVGSASGKAFDMDRFRSDVAARLKGSAGGDTTPTPTKPESTSIEPKPRIDSKTMNTQVATASAAWPFIEDVEKEYNLLKGTLYAVGSRETNLKNVIGDGGHGFGVWQRDNRYWNVDEDYLKDVKKQATDAATLLAANYKALGTWGGAIAAYNAGLTAVKTAIAAGKNPDSITTGGDYAADVLGRRLLIAVPEKEEESMPTLDEIAKAVVAELRSSQVTVDEGKVQLKDAWRRSLQNTVDLRKAAADLQKEVATLKAALTSTQNELVELQASVEGKLTEEAIKAALANAQITLKIAE